MPFTPYHFGPGAVLHAAAPKHVSFLAFCAANVVTDVESLYYLVTWQYPVHRFLHTYVGATVTLIITVGLFLAARGIAARTSLPNLFKWQELTIKQVVVGAALGAYSHVVLDSIMHEDMAPVAPFNQSNILLGIVSLSALHWFCLGSAGVGLSILGVRRLFQSGAGSR